MKFTIVCICMLLVLVTFCAVLSGAVTATTHARSETVGLYAPDRYEGIPEKCLQPMDFGYCRAKVKRYYFDLRRMKCTMFFWGGCAGNLNNFKSVDDCNKVCLDGIEDNAFAQNAAPAPSYASNAARSTPTVTKKFASPSSSSSKINENVNNNYKESALPTYSSSNFNKFKINRNFNVPSTTKESIVDDIDEEEDYDN